MKNIKLNKIRQKINNLSKNKRVSQRINLSGVDDIRRLLSGGNVYDLTFKYSNPEAERLFEDKSATSAWVEKGYSDNENLYVIYYFNLPEMISSYKKESSEAYGDSDDYIDDYDDAVDWWANATDKYGLQNPKIKRNRTQFIFNGLDELLNFIKSNFDGIKNVKAQD